MSLDASRLARNNRDWHQLLELCSLFGALIVDGERLYDPCPYHDRLLLGLSGIMSEAELHQIKIRLHQGERQKATRGELRLPLPAGLIHSNDGPVRLVPAGPSVCLQGHSPAGLRVPIFGPRRTFRSRFSKEISSLDVQRIRDPSQNRDAG
jgi:hypothetical protein